MEKTSVLLATLLALGCALRAQTPPAPEATSPRHLPSTVFDWETLPVETRPNGVRRAVFDSPTTTLDKVHCHITTLNPGADSGAPRRHLQEEIFIVKEGLIEMHIDGRLQTVGPGSVIFCASNAVTRLRNAGDSPATYTVIYYYTPLTPRE